MFEIASRKSIWVIEMDKIVFFLEDLIQIMRKYRILPLVVLIGCLLISSCSFQTNFHQPDRDKNGSGSGYRSGGYVVEDDGDYPFPSISPNVITDAEARNPRLPPPPEIKTARRQLCSPFVPPVVPESPRVDLTKLRSIPGNDHDAVKNLLIDNIEAMNKHAQNVEAALKEAYRKHRLTCAAREIVIAR